MCVCKPNPLSFWLFFGVCEFYISRGGARVCVGCTHTGTQNKKETKGFLKEKNPPPFLSSVFPRLDVHGRCPGRDHGQRGGDEANGEEDGGEAVATVWVGGEREEEGE